MYFAFTLRTRQPGRVGLSGGSATRELTDSVCDSLGENVLRILYYRGWLVNHVSQYIQANRNLGTVYATLYKEQPRRITQQT